MFLDVLVKDEWMVRLVGAIPQKAFKKIIDQFKVGSTLTTSFPALQDSVSAAASKRARYSGKECFYSEEAKLLSKDINKLKTRLLAEPSRDSTRAFLIGTQLKEKRKEFRKAVSALGLERTKSLIFDINAPPSKYYSIMP